MTNTAARQGRGKSDRTATKHKKENEKRSPKKKSGPNNRNEKRNA